MQTFEFILLLLACVIVSAVLDQMTTRMSLPLIQICIGVVAGFFLTDTSMVQLDSELFLVLFIAPLLFDEARHTNRKQLWRSKWSILSLAIGLVIAIVLAVGFTLHAMVPSIPLAAAFACGAALGPTDAAAVAALGQTVHLSTRQKTLLSGESLINDASGVVSFQFAVAAATTGTFSLVDAGGKFAVLFFGGIASGVAMGFALRWMMRAVRRHGYESTTVHVTYEVLTPFVVYLAAEALGVSGILAVVAAGLAMAEPPTRLTSTSMTRHRFVSNGVWEVIVFLINGFLFIMLGMQLPQAMNPALTEDSTPAHVLVLYVLTLTVLIELVRFVWVSVMELTSVDAQSGRRGWHDPLSALRRAATTTVAGPKGAVTLSIIFTIPYFAGGEPFPNRDLIIFLTAGVILCTLLLADMLLPVLAPVAEDGTDEGKMPLEQARVEVLNEVIRELQHNMDERTRPEFEPATRAVIGQYRRRIITSERTDVPPETMARLRVQILDQQCDYLDQARSSSSYEPTTISKFERALSRRRKMLGADVGKGAMSRLVGWCRRQVLVLRRGLTAARRAIAHRFASRQDPDATIEMTPVQRRESEALSAKLERVAIEYLKDYERREGRTVEEHKAATVLLEEHRVALAAIKTRQAGRAQADGGDHDQARPGAIGTIVLAGDAPAADAGREAPKPAEAADERQGSGLAGRLRGVGGRLRHLRPKRSADQGMDDERRAAVVRRAYAANMSRILGIDLTGMNDDQVELLSSHLGEVEEGALAIELDKIRHLSSVGKIDAKTAKELREDTYVLQLGVAGR